MQYIIWALVYSIWAHRHPISHSLSSSYSFFSLSSICGWIIILSFVLASSLLSCLCYSIPGHLLEQNKCFWVGWEAVRQVQLWASNDSQHRTVCNAQREDNAFTCRAIDNRVFSALSLPQVMVVVCKALYNCIVSRFIPCSVGVQNVQQRHCGGTGWLSESSVQPQLV